MMSVESTLVQAPKVTIGSNSSPLDQYWASRMVSLSLEMELQVPTRLTMRFTTPVLGTAAPGFPFEIGTKVSVALPTSRSGGGVSFSAPCGALYVTEIGAEREGDSSGEFVVVAHDASFRLTRRHHVATFASMTASDVAARVAADAGLSRGTIDSTGEQLPYLLQSDTDFGFITTLARRYGYDWWVDGDSFHFCKPPTSPPVVSASVTDDLIRFSVRTSAVASPEVTVNGWDRDRQEKVTASARPSSLPANQVPGVSDAHNGVDRATPLSTASVRVASQSEAETVARAIVTSQMASAVEAQGELPGDPEIRPGVVVEVTGAHLGGRYHVTEVEHRYTEAGFITRFSAGDRAPTGLADLIGSGTLHEHLGSYSGLPALIPAVVTQIGTGENLGRVKVKFPFLSEGDDSHWARVLSAGGGPERGFWFLPETDDEVLVAFEGGDTRFPVVMGGLYGTVNTPESQLINDGKINSRSVRSRLGHYMDFVDGTSADQRHIMLGLGSDGQPGTDYKLRIGEDRFDIEVPEGKPIAIKAGAAQITFTDQKAIQISADAITIKADKDLVLEGKSVTMKGTQDLTVTQGSNKVAMGSGGVEVKGTPSTSIKGGPQVAIG
jgi:uncharacterized protein involved in type VI secretion and phage assembly